MRDVRKIQLEVNIHSAPLYANAFGMAEATRFFEQHGFEPHVSWTQSLNREANVIFRNRAHVPPRAITAPIAWIEQCARRAEILWHKLPRILAVTAGMLRRKVTGAR